MRKRRIIVGLGFMAILGLVAFLSWPSFEAAYRCYRIGHSFDEWDTFQERIRDADSVDILILGGRAEEGKSPDIDGYMPYRAISKTVVTGEALRPLARRWYNLIYSPRHTGLCHSPPYGLRYHKAGQSLGEATICWQCGNIYLKSRGIDDLYGFDSASGRWLFDELQKLAPLPQKSKK